MLFRQLEYFVALAREGHFARAASACFVSQPALSEAIRKLEHELRVPLVRRGHAYEGLTPEGERLLPWARRILADHNALKNEVSALQSGLTGELTLGVVPAAASTVALLVDPLCAAHPLLRVRLEASLRSREIVDRVKGFELDAGIVYADAADEPGLLLTPLYLEQQVLIAGDDLLTGLPAVMGWPQALQLPICALSVGMHGRLLVDNALAAAGLALAPQVETDSVVALMTLVNTGRWASIVPRPWLRVLPRAPHIRVVPMAGPAVTAQMALVTNAGQPHSVLTQALLRAAGEIDLNEILNGSRPHP